MDRRRRTLAESRSRRSGQATHERNFRCDVRTQTRARTAFHCPPCGRFLASHHSALRHIMNLAPSESLTPSGTEDRTTLKVFSLEISQDRLWFWGLRSGLSLLDQGLFSGSSFLLNIFLARWLSKEAYGAFAVCFAGMLFLTGFHNVLLIEPMTVIGPSCYPDRLIRYFGAQLR